MQFTSPLSGPGLIKRENKTFAIFGREASSSLSFLIKHNQGYIKGYCATISYQQCALLCLGVYKWGEVFVQQDRTVYSL